jgi:peptidyl-prolyl cis-trans isomerase C
MEPRPHRALAACVLAALAAGCGSGSSSDEGGRVLAEIGGRRITEADVDARLEELPRLSRPEFSGPIGKERMLQQIVEQEILYRAAIDEGLDRDEEIRKQLRDHERQVLVQAYLDRKQEEVSRVTDEEARAWYDAHPEEYTTERMRRVRMLWADTRERAETGRERVVQGALTFPEVCARFSTHPPAIEALGMIPTWVRDGKAVDWIGNHPKFHEVVASLELDEVSEVFETARGFHVVRVEEVREPALRPFGEVQRDIRGRLSRQKSTEGLPDLLAGLKERYHVKVHESPGRSADELFAQAQAASDATERIRLYEEIVERYPDDALALESHFMIGFIRSEELKDSVGAAAAFEKVIELAPDSDLARSARWMLTSGANEVPEFEDGADARPQEGSS